MSDDKKTVRVERRFAASAERVFDAWLDPARAGQFLFATATGEMVRVDIDARVGGRFVIVERRDGVDTEHTGVYEVIDRPSRLVFTFAVPMYSADYTRVTLDITPEGEGCHLTLTHEGVLPEWAEGTVEGWGMILEGLERILTA